MPTNDEMQRGLEFSQSRADGYREIAAKGGEGRMSAAAAEAEAARFQRFADKIARRIEERNSLPAPGRRGPGPVTHPNQTKEHDMPLWSKKDHQNEAVTADAKADQYEAAGNHEAARTCKEEADAQRRRAAAYDNCSDCKNGVLHHH